MSMMQRCPTLRDPAGECPVSFWRFAGPLLAGNLASMGAAYATRAALQDAHAETRQTAGAVVGLSAFWLVAGLGWVIANRR